MLLAKLNEMRRLVKIFFCVVLLNNAYSQDLKCSNCLSSDFSTYDLGILSKGSGIILKDFVLANVSNKPVIINDVLVECSCTKPKWTSDTILPNSSGTISVGFNPNGNSGEFKKEVSVVTSYDTLELVLRGVVISSSEVKTINDFPYQIGSLRFEKDVLSMMAVYDSYPVQRTFKLFNTSSSGVKSIQYTGLPENINIEIPNEISPNSVGDFIVKYDTTKNRTYGWIKHDFQITEGVISKSMAITANVTPGLVLPVDEVPIALFLEGDELELNTLMADTTYRFNVLLGNNGESDLKILEVKPSCECVKLVSLSENKVAPNKSTVATLSFSTHNREGKTKKHIYFYTNDPYSPAKVFTITGRVKKRTE